MIMNKIWQNRFNIQLPLIRGSINVQDRGIYLFFAILLIQILQETGKHLNWNSTILIKHHHLHHNNNKDWPQRLLPRPWRTPSSWQSSAGFGSWTPQPDTMDDDVFFVENVSPSFGVSQTCSRTWKPFSVSAWCWNIKVVMWKVNRNLFYDVLNQREFLT